MSGFVPTYRRTGSSLHSARASIAACYVASLCAIAIFFDHPAVLGAALAAVVGAGCAAGVAGELAKAARLAIPLALLVAVVNPLVSAEGLTVLVSGPVVPVLGRVDITLEALAYGGVTALRVFVVITAFALYSAAVDPDEVLRLFRRLSFRSALTASLATRLVPVLGRDASALSEAYRLRAAAPVTSGRLAGARRAAVVARALAAGALERSVEVATSLEVRGFAAPRRRRRVSRGHEPWSRHDLAFAAGALAVAALCILGALARLDRFDPYPALSVEHGPPDLVLLVALPLAALAPWLAPRPWRRLASAAVARA